MVSAAYQMVKGPKVTEIVVPYHVLREGDTLEGICCRLKDEYGDKRDWREIAFYVCKDNNKKDGWVYLGEKSMCACMSRSKQSKKAACIKRRRHGDV